MRCGLLLLAFIAIKNGEQHFTSQVAQCCYASHARYLNQGCEAGFKFAKYGEIDESSVDRGACSGLALQCKRSVGRAGARVRVKDALDGFSYGVE